MKSSGATWGRMGAGQGWLLPQQLPFGGWQYFHDSSPSFCPCVCCRNKGMRTRLGCLSHKSDSCSDFTAILPDKPNRALKWVIGPHCIPRVSAVGCSRWDYTTPSSLVDGWRDEPSDNNFQSLGGFFSIFEHEWKNIFLFKAYGFKIQNRDPPFSPKKAILSTTLIKLQWRILLCST